MATATIETLAKPEDAGDDFVVFRDVPIFDEHEMVEEHPVTGVRKIVRYTRDVLQSMADNMNRRIAQSGDRAPLCIGHTHPDPRIPKPEVVGYADTFRVARFKDRYAIFSDWFVYRADADKVRKNPRRSVEVIPEDNPADRWFDPIALLGAETPRRDLGLLYSRPNDGEPRYRYSIASGANTFTPAPIGSDGKQRNELAPDCVPINTEPRLGKGVKIDPESMQQIIAAVDLMLDSKISMRLQDMGANGGINASIEPVPTGDPAPPADPLAANPAAPNADPLQDPNADPLMNDPEGNPLADPAAEDPPTDPPQSDPAIDPANAPPNAAQPDPAPAPGPSPAPNAKEDDDPLDKRQRYALEYTRLFQCGELTDCQQLAERLAGTPEGQLLNDAMHDCPDRAAKIHYQKHAGRFDPATIYREPVTMSAEVRDDDYKIRYQQSEQARQTVMEELQTARARVAELEATVADGERRKILYSLEQEKGIIFELEEELTNANGLTDDQFNRHVETMKTRYQRRPPTKMIPTELPGEKAAAHAAPTDGDEAETIRKLDAVATQRTTKIIYALPAEKKQSANFKNIFDAQRKDVVQEYQETGAVPA